VSIEATVTDHYSPPTALPIPSIPDDYVLLRELFELLSLLHDHFPALSIYDEQFGGKLSNQLRDPLNAGSRACLGSYVAFNHPFLLPFERRFQYLRALARDLSRSSTKVQVSVDRAHIFSQGRTIVSALGPSGQDFVVEFPRERNEIGAAPTQEFFTLLALEFSQQTGTWRDYTLGLFPTSAADERLLYEFGMLCAQALVMDCRIPLSFNLGFFALALGRRVAPGDVDPDMAASLVCRAGLEGRAFVDPLTDVKLIENGQDIIVDSENVDQYIRLVEEFACGEIICRKVGAWLDGFAEIVDPSLLRMFSPFEINEMLCGCEAQFTMHDLRQNLRMERFEGIEYIRDNFLEVIAEMSPRDKALFIKFVTASPRLPLGGLAAMTQPITVRARIGEDGVGDHTLPTVTTCRSYIKLPPYSTKAVMKGNILTAIHHGQDWFGFS
jgi:E3 ubiquitin-protein ligase TRIP12